MKKILSPLLLLLSLAALSACVIEPGGYYDGHDHGEYEHHNDHW